MSRVRVLPAMMVYGISRLWRSAFSSSNDVGKTNHPRRPTVLHNQLEMKTTRCLRCSTLFNTCDNSPTACSFHGHTTGEKGLFSLAPPIQGIDGEWSDRSGVIGYRWNDKENRPSTGRGNWKRRWSCCAEYGEDAMPCRREWNVSYEDDFTLY